MQLRHVVIKVDDQDKALRFYTEVLGFVKKADFPGKVRWLTVSSPEGIEGVELVLEPNHFPPALLAQKTLYDAGFPAAVLTSQDLAGEYRRLKSRGVKFRNQPADAGPVAFCFFEDTCGNLIVLNQVAASADRPR